MDIPPRCLSGEGLSAPMILRHCRVTDGYEVTISDIVQGVIAESPRGISALVSANAISSRNTRLGITGDHSCCTPCRGSCDDESSETGLINPQITPAHGGFVRTLDHRSPEGE